MSNAIWLCSNCAELIDRDERRFSVELLHQWKATAESLTQLEHGKPLPSRTELKRLKSDIKRAARHNKSLADKLKQQGKKAWVYLAGGTAVLGIIGVYGGPLLWLKEIEEAHVEFTYQRPAAGGYAFDLVNHAPFSAVIEIMATPFGEFSAQTTAAMPLERFLHPSEIAYPFLSRQELGPHETRRIRLPPVVPSLYMTAKEAQAKVELQARPVGMGPSAVVARLVGKAFASTKIFEIIDDQWFEGSGTRSGHDRRCIEAPMDVDCTTPGQPHVLPIGAALSPPTADIRGSPNTQLAPNTPSLAQCESAVAALRLPFDVWCSEAMKSNWYSDYFECTQNGQERYDSARDSAQRIIATCKAEG